jgi:N6-adenosine-specific RNA methylase IME4
MIKINEEFKNLIPVLSENEYHDLEDSVICNGMYETIKTWNGYIIDGHNRYNIAVVNGCEHILRFEALEFDNETEVKIWIVNNQLGRRNINDYVRATLSLKKKEWLAEIAKENQIRKPVRKPVNSVLPTLAKQNVREELAKEAGISHGTMDKVEKINHNITPETKAKLESGDWSINKVWTEIKKEENAKKLNSIEVIEVKKIEGVFDVIVIDPPWDMKKISREVSPEQAGFDYPTMTQEELKELNIQPADNCHVWLWTTNKFLPDALELLNEWGIKYICTFVWHKNGGFQPFGLPQYNCEFALYGHIGNPEFTTLKDFNLCFSADRTKHSEKPEVFYDMVRNHTAGRRLDMFNRREINGFETWGNEAK